MSTINTPVRLGIVGLTGYGRTYFKTLAGRTDVTISAICDTNSTALAEVGDTYGITQQFTRLDDLLATELTDAVCIATPHFLHHPMVLDALHAGQHVFCEKPLTITAAHSDELVSAARERERVLTCHYNQRTTDHIAALRGLIRDGAFGDVYSIRASWMARHTEFLFDTATSWRLSREKSGGGIFIGRGSHLIDAALHLLDFPNVTAINATMSGRLANGDVDDFAQATLKLESGASISIEVSYLAHLPDPPERQEWRVLGTKGGAEYRSDAPLEKRLRAGTCAFPETAWEDLAIRDYREATPRSLLIDFVGAIRDKRTPFVTAEQAALVTCVLEAGYRSADTGREVLLSKMGNHV